MPRITFQSRSLDCATGQSVLDCLNAAGMAIPWSCGAGACQTCVMRVVSGRVDPRAQAGLKPTLAAQGYFLACQWRPDEDVEVCAGEPTDPPAPARVLDVTPLNQDVVRLRLEPATGYDYRPGQFLQLYRSDGVSRCYSLASVPALGEALELHVRRVPGGTISNWIHDELTRGDAVNISPARGDSFYLAGRPDRGLCLIGTGSGLAPLYGIARDALQQKHTGPLWLFHGSAEAAGLYLCETLEVLQRRYANFHYVPCVLRGSAPGLTYGNAHEAALSQLPRLEGWSVHLCGSPRMIEAARRTTFLAGASSRDIHCDPFLPGAPQKTGDRHSAQPGPMP